MEYSKFKIIASISTLPDRLVNKHILHVLDSILNQSVNVDHIEFNIPTICKRTGQTYVIPEFLNRSPYKEKVEIHKTDDFGPITKIYPTLRRYTGNNSILILSFDDDTLYAYDTVETILSNYKPNSIVGFCGSIFTLNGYTAIFGEKTYNLEPDFLEGFACILYPATIFTNSESDNKYFKTVLSDQKSCRSDDIILSNFALKNGFSIRRIRNISLGDFITQISLGLDDKNALHKLDTGHQSRYHEVLNFLRQHNEYFFNFDPTKKETNTSKRRVFKWGVSSKE